MLHNSLQRREKICRVTNPTSKAPAVEKREGDFLRPRVTHTWLVHSSSIYLKSEMMYYLHRYWLGWALIIMMVPPSHGRARWPLLPLRPQHLGRGLSRRVAEIAKMWLFFFV